MAYVQNFNEEEDPNNPKNPNGTSENVIQTSTGGSGYVGGGQASQAPSAGGSSGRWNNLQNYLSSNQGENTQKLGSAITDKANDLTNAANTNVNQIKDTTAQNVQQNTIQKDDNLISGLKADPTKVNLDGFKKLATAQYKGPAQGDFSGAQQSRTNADTYADQVQSTDIGKKEQALKSTFNDSNYGRGSAVLDSFIGFGDDVQNKRISGAASQNQQSLRDTLSNASSNISNRINQARQTTDDTRNATLGAFHSAVTDTKTGITEAQKSLADRLEAKRKNTSGVMAGLDSTDAGARQKAYEALGISADAGDKFLKSGAVGRDKLFSVNGDQALGDVIGDDVQSRYAALAGLGSSIGNDLEKYDFAKTGNSADDFNINKDNLGRLNELGGLSKILDAKLALKNSERKSQQNELKNAIDQYRLTKGTMGIGAGAAQDQLDAVKNKYGLNNFNAEDLLDSGVNYGRDLNVGDVASDAERSRFKELLDLVGASNNPYGDISDIGDEGQAFNVDMNKYGAIQNEKERQAAQRLAEYNARLAEEEARKNRQSPFQGRDLAYNGRENTERVGSRGGV